MESAFGIDHGEEVSKLGLGGLSTKLGTKIAGGTQKLGQSVRGRGAGVLKQVKTTPHPNPGFNAGANKVGAGYVRAGGAIRGMGQKMAARPGLTGGAALGAGGAGAAGGLFANRRRQM